MPKSRHEVLADARERHRTKTIYEKERDRERAIRLRAKGSSRYERHARRQKALREKALRVYGKSDHPRCMCECGCQEDRFPLLEIDHVNNDGAAHRRAIRKSRTSKNWLKFLQKMGWPNDPPLRVLCVKCNVGRQRNAGQCVELGIVTQGRRTPKPITTEHNCTENNPLFDYIDKSEVEIP